VWAFESTRKPSPPKGKNLDGAQALSRVVGCRGFLGQVIQDRWCAQPESTIQARHLIERQPTQMAVPLLEWF
jgi:hypothetical protein